MSEQVRQKHHRAVQQRDDHEIAPGEVALNLPGQVPHPPGKLRLSDELALDFLSPLGQFPHFSVR